MNRVLVVPHTCLCGLFIWMEILLPFRSVTMHHLVLANCIRCVVGLVPRVDAMQVLVVIVVFQCLLPYIGLTTEVALDKAFCARAVEHVGDMFVTVGSSSISARILSGLVQFPRRRRKAQDSGWKRRGTSCRMSSRRTSSRHLKGTKRASHCPKKRSFILENVSMETTFSPFIGHRLAKSSKLTS